MKDTMKRIRSRLSRHRSRVLHAQREATAAEAVGRKSLLFATKVNDTELALKSLLGNNESPRREDAEGRTPLHYAAANGNTDVIQVVCNAGASLDQQDIWGKTALQFAAREGHVSAVDLLLRYGADPNLVDMDGNMAIHDATLINAAEVIACLVEFGSKLEACNKVTGMNPLEIAADKGMSAAATQLLKSGADPNHQGAHECTALHRAVMQGHMNIVQALLDASADIHIFNSMGNTALHLAVDTNCHDALNLLPNDAVKSNEEKEESMDIRKLKIVVKLLDAGGDVNTRNVAGWSVLHSAVIYQSMEANLDIIRTLIDSNIDLDLADQQGLTALHWAANTNKPHIVRLLLENGANPAVYDTWKRTPLHWAAMAGNHEVIHALVTHGVDVDLLDHRKRTALHWAIEKHSLDGVKNLFLSTRANPNVQDIWNWTPLCVASYEFKSWDIHGQGANPQMEDRLKQIKGSILSIIQILIQKGAIADVPLKNGLAGVLHKTLLDMQRAEIPAMLLTTAPNMNGIADILEQEAVVDFYKDYPVMEHLQHYASNPFPLQMLARKCIVAHISCRQTLDSTCLPLPSALNNYLTFPDADDSMSENNIPENT